MNLFAKARVLVLGNLHELLDAGIDLNSIGVVRQHVRDLEQARDGIRAQVAIGRGRAKSLKVEIHRLEREIAEDLENIDFLLSDSDASNDAHAVTIQLQVSELEERLATLKGEAETAERTQTEMESVLAKIEQKHRDMLSQVKMLERQEQTAKSKEQAADALEQVTRMSNIDAGASVDSAASRIRDRAAVADARLEQALGGITSDTDESVALAKAREAIAKRRAELQNKEKAA